MDGSCDTKCHYNNNIDGYIDGSGQAKNIGYQRVGIFGIVTMPVDNSDILKEDFNAIFSLITIHCL